MRTWFRRFKLKLCLNGCILDASVQQTTTSPSVNLIFKSTVFNFSHIPQGSEEQFGEMYGMFKMETLIFFLLLTIIEYSCTSEANRHLELAKNEYFEEPRAERNQQDIFFIRENVTNYCNEEIYAANFSIKSPDYPLRYDYNMDCVYTIRKSSPDAIELLVTFVDFDLEKSTGCQFDYIEMNGERYCGDGPLNGTIIHLPFHNNKIRITFHSDDSVSARGFHLIAHQTFSLAEFYTRKFIEMLEPHNCTEVMSSKKFTIRSPNYPENYDNNTDCLYKIRKFSQDVCELQLTFVDFHLERNFEDCNYDYLEVEGQRYCGQGPDYSLRLDFKNREEIFMRFHSDNSVRDTGFYISGRQKTKCSASSKPRRRMRPH